MKKIVCTFCFLLALQTINRTWADCVPLPSGIVSWWSGDGHSKELINGQSSTFFGSFVTGKVGKAFNFIGEPFVMASPADLSLTNGLTVELWIRPSSLSDGQTASILTRADGTNTFFALLLEQQNGTVELQAMLGTSGGTKAILTAGSVATNTWSHVALTYDAGSGQARMFLNGSVIASTQCALPALISGGNLVFGGDNSPSENTYVGLLDEVSLYNRALSSEELGAIVASDADGKCKQADLVLTATVSGNPVLAGTNLTWTVALTNRGIGTATNVSFSVTIPSTGCETVSMALPQGSYSSTVSYRMPGSFRSGTVVCGTAVSLHGNNDLLGFGRSVTATVVLNFFGTGAYELLASALPATGDVNTIGRTNVVDLMITGSPQIHTLRSNSSLEIYWADKYWMNQYGFYDRFVLEESACDGPASWQPTTNQIVAGNYRARIVNNVTAAPSRIYRLSENTNLPPEFVGGQE